MSKLLCVRDDDASGTTFKVFFESDLHGAMLLSQFDDLATFREYVSFLKKALGLPVEYMRYVLSEVSQPAFEEGYHAKP